jgi:hypothetical protein
MTCEACHTPIPPGAEHGNVGDYALCADMTACLDRMFTKPSDEKQEDGGK